MRKCISAFLCLALAVLMGCNSKTSVSGDVTYNGSPVENGYMSFSPIGKGRSIAAPIASGKYSIPEAISGKYTAVAIGTRKINHYSSSADAYANAGPNAGHLSEAADYIAADAEGNSKEVEITSGDQQLDFAITGPPMPK
jgi:expansin (peptidoglycan-binding protein)